VRSSIAIVLGLLAPMQLAAQAPGLPPTYSFVEINSMIAPNMTVKVYRDGAREILLQTRPVSADSPKGYNGGLYYDFKEHFLFVWDASDGTPNCGRQAYADSTAPSLFDVVSGSAEMLKEAAPVMKKPGVADAVNGIPATAWSVADTAHGGSTRIWVADKTGYLLKLISTPKDGAPIPFLEVKSLSMAKPPASAFTVPPTCKQP
jgi:hypothetical protein